MAGKIWSAKLFSSETPTLTANSIAYTSSFDIGACTGVSFHLQWTGTISGTLEPEFSNHPDPEDSDSADWTSDPVLNAAISGTGNVASGHRLVDLSDVQARHVRLKISAGKVSGGGVLSGHLMAKES
jgi:hypothetical protein